MMKKTAEDHWNYIKSLTEATLAGNAETSVVFSHEELLALIGFHYRTAFIHGWKHALEAQKDATLPLTLETRSCRSDASRCRAEAESCVRGPRSTEGNAESCRPDLDAAVSDVSVAGKPRSAAGDFGEEAVDKIIHNDTIGKAPTQEEISFVLSFLREDR